MPERPLYSRAVLTEMADANTLSRVSDCRKVVLKKREIFLETDRDTEMGRKRRTTLSTDKCCIFSGFNTGVSKDRLYIEKLAGSLCIANTGVVKKIWNDSLEAVHLVTKNARETRYSLLIAKKRLTGRGGKVELKYKSPLVNSVPWYDRLYQGVDTQPCRSYNPFRGLHLIIKKRCLLFAYGEAGKGIRRGATFHEGIEHFCQIRLC